MSKGKSVPWLRALLRKWARRLGLEDWNIFVELAPEDLDDSGFSAGFKTTGTASVEWQYKEAKLTFPLWLLQRDENYIEEVVVHELMHIVLNQMRNYKRDHLHEERVATELSRAFLKVAKEAK